MMKYDASVTLCLAVALLGMAGGLTLVSAKSAGAMPTPAPLMTSTAKPTNAPKIEVKPTEAIILNVPPKRTMPEDKKQQQMVAAPTEAMPESTAALRSGVPVPLQGQLRVKDAKPVQVTGFITKSGSIYEIEGKDGIGQIEGRQADSQSPNVCNYGTIVIYSDLPCDQVTNVQVGEVQQHNINLNQAPETEQPAAAAVAAPAEVAAPATEASPTNAEGDKEGDELAGAANENAPRGQGQRRRQQSANKRRRRNGNKRNKNKRRGVQNGTGNRRRQQVGQRKRRRPQGQRQKPAKRNQQQKRRRQQQQQKRRRQQQKQQKQRRRQQQQRRKTNANSRRYIITQPAVSVV